MLSLSFWNGGQQNIGVHRCLSLLPLVWKGSTPKKAYVKVMPQDM